MKYTQYIANVDESLYESVLSDWKWIIGESLKVIQITKFGDLILIDEDNSIHFLSTAWAELMQIANNFNEYEKFANESENLEEWFYKEFVDGQELIKIISMKNECLSLDVPLVLGGELLPDNINSCDIDVHFSIIGQIHQQINKLDNKMQ